MAPRPSVAAPYRAPSAGPSPALDPALLKRLKSDLLTEHFRFAPETFAKGGMDLANRTMYTATAMVEQSLQKLIEDGVPGFNEDEVQRGVYRLETLLEDAIDTQFDLFEIYVLRNTFTFKDELLPYLALPHHEHLDPTLRASDPTHLEAYETELAAYQAELDTERELAAAELFLQAKVARARATAELVGYLKPPGKLDPTSAPTSPAHLVASQLSALQARLSELLATPQPLAPSSTEVGGGGAGGGSTADRNNVAAAPWASSRSAFVNWAAQAKTATSAAAAAPREGAGAVAAAAAAGGGGGGGGAGSESAATDRWRARAYATGTAQDAKTLLGLADAAPNAD